MTPNPHHVDRPRDDWDRTTPAPVPDPAELLETAKAIEHRRQHRVAVGATRINPNVPRDERTQPGDTGNEYGDFD